MAFKSLQIKTTGQIAEEAKAFIERRKQGKEPSLRVASEKVNDTFLNGFDWNRIITVAGLSGSGKSTLVRQWLSEFISLNKNQKFEVLSFQFEMLGIDELARDVSSKLELSIKDIYSATTPLSDSLLAKVYAQLENLKDYPINVVDNPGTVKEIKDTILNFVEQKRLLEEKKGLVITIDHSLLVKRDDREDEKACLDNLMHTLVSLKKYLSSIGIKVIFILISQLNRNLETTERITNPKLHYPNKNDLFGASSVYNGSDYVIIVHRPCVIDGLGNWYGPPRKGWSEGLPVFNPADPNQAMIYLHVIKERFGKPSILAMLDNLKYSKISEYIKP